MTGTLGGIALRSFRLVPIWVGLRKADFHPVHWKAPDVCYDDRMLVTSQEQRAETSGSLAKHRMSTHTYRLDSQHERNSFLMNSSRVTLALLALWHSSLAESKTGPLFMRPKMTLDLDLYRVRCNPPYSIWLWLILTSQHCVTSFEITPSRMPPIALDMLLSWVYLGGPRLLHIDLGTLFCVTWESDQGIAFGMQLERHLEKHWNSHASQ